jgi:3alpha(or 20beta)-hydroxysteroid dehydrogenase
MNLDLDMKVAVVTGGAGAIGSATARLLAQEGSRVAIGDVDATAGEAVVKDIRTTRNANVAFFPLDLKNEGSITEFVESVVATFGGIDIIINNAAVFHFSPLKKWTAVDVAALDEHYQVGLRGAALLVREVWRRSERSLGGCVVNVSSIAGHVAEPNAVAYTTIKAAQKGFTLSCAIEMAPFGGWAVSVSPGHTWSPSHRRKAQGKGMDREEYERTSSNIQTTMFGRFLEPEEVAEWIVLAASRLGKAITGEDLHVTFGIEAGGFNRNYENLIPTVEELGNLGSADGPSLG